MPLARSEIVAPWVEQLRRLGAPVEPLLLRAGIRPELLQPATAVVPLHRALRWIELVCRYLGTEHAGLQVGCLTCNADLGAYGRVLAGARTLHEYLHQGIAGYGAVVSGQSFWLSSHGTQVRLNLGAPWEPGLGDYQAHLHSFGVTIANIRRFAGPRWAPSTISFGFRTREAVPRLDLFEGARVQHRPGPSYLEFPRAILGLRRDHGPGAPPAGQSPELRSLPQDLPGLVELQIESLLAGQPVPIDLVAETLGLSRRSLQRGLAAYGVRYVELLASVRARRAAELLECTDRPVVEIAFELGYSDASNFTRAFRRQTGVSPTAFREGTERR